jgi:TolA-binding protein
MSAKLRSLIDYLKAPLRLWRRGRHLPARVQVTLLLAGAFSIVIAFAVWTVARATPAQNGGEADAEGRAVYERVHQLRTVDKDYAAARAIALEYLNAHPDRTVVRQLLEYEYAATLYAERDWPKALELLRGFVRDYGGSWANAASEDMMVDDALFISAVIQQHGGQREAAIDDYEAVVARYPDGNRADRALLQLGGLYQELGKTQLSRERYEQLAAGYPTSDCVDDAQFFLAGLSREEGNLRAAAEALMKLPDTWPNSEYAADALFWANRALIEEEGKVWNAGGVEPQADFARNASLVQANLQRLGKDYSTSTKLEDAYLDVINYYRHGAWWAAEQGDTSNREVARLAEAMIAALPNARKTLDAKTELALSIWREEPDRALALVEEVVAAGVAAGDETVRVGGMFSKGAILLKTGHPASARAVLEQIVDAPMVPVMAMECRLTLIGTYTFERDYEKAAELLAEIDARSVPAELTDDFEALKADIERGLDRTRAAKARTARG